VYARGPYDADRAIIPFAEFLKRAKALAGKGARGAEFERGVKDAYLEAKRFVEDPIGEVAPPRFYFNPKRNRRHNPTDWALAYEGRLHDLTAESDGLIRVGKRNPTRSFRTRDGRVVTFQTKSKRRA
jgi:hypothetical protein